MPTKEEKAAFAQRLRMALSQFAASNPNTKAIKGATDLARQFNLKHGGEIGISAQSAHKWLTGQMIPTANKIKTLAEWLGVTEHWLHYGLPPATKSKVNRLLSLPTLRLVEEIEKLPPHQRYLIEELIKQFAQDARLF